MDDLLRHLLSATPSPDPIPDVERWWAAHRNLAARFPAPIDLALAGGFAADRLGWAFASGYQAAGRVLFTGQPPEVPLALCATESGGNHPRAIRTRLTPGEEGRSRLSGEKTFVTLGSFARCFLVVATRGEDAEGRPRLVLVAVDSGRDGVTITEAPATPFVPEVPHAVVILDEVDVGPDDLFPGDGYSRYLKPFRTVEDLHVHAALIGWLMRVGRSSGWPASVLGGLAAAASTSRGLAPCDPSSPGTHVALADLMATVGDIASELTLWSSVDATVRAGWERDQSLLSVAGSARQKRLERAWQLLADDAKPSRPGRP